MSRSLCNIVQARGLCPGLALTACILLAGCFGREDVASRSDMSPGAVPALAPQKDVASPLIADLLARKTILPASGPYSDVAAAVIRASSGAAQAELRVARLRADAQAKNWLPKIGPDVSLTSLSSIAAGMILETAILDNGRRKAERAYAAADVEVAAVSLSDDLNKRVFDGLAHYIAAERAREQAAVSERAEARLAEFERIMRVRVEGGLSDGSERAVVSQKHLEMKATVAADRQSEMTAMAELAAVAGGPLPALRGIQPLPRDIGAPEPLSVVKTRAEGARLVAQAKSERSGLLPNLGFDANVSRNGIKPEVNLSGLMGLGNRDANKALDTAGEVSERRIADATEDSNRTIVALTSQIAMLENQQIEGDIVLKQTAANFESFSVQYKAGRRTLLELVSQYDDYARLERDQVSLRYQAAALRLQIARDRGVLVDGGRM